MLCYTKLFSSWSKNNTLFYNSYSDLSLTILIWIFVSYNLKTIEQTSYLSHRLKAKQACVPIVSRLQRMQLSNP